MTAVRRLNRREFVRWTVAAGGISATIPDVLAAHPKAKKRIWRIGHHFWNWDHAWNYGHLLDTRLRLTKETGYEGFEAKPDEIGRPAAEVREKCEQLGLELAAVGGGVKEGFDYAQAAGTKIVRALLPKHESKRWVERGAEHGIIFVAHPHVGKPGDTNAVETREDLLRYLDERPGVFACPDTGHLALCGSDPVQTIRDLGGRCRYIHLKDIRPERVGIKHGPGEKFCELGTGALDLAGVIKALEDIRYEGWIMVERDSREPDYIQSAKNMRAVLRRYGY